MSKVDIKNISGGDLSFITFRTIVNNEVLLLADDAQLGSEITGIIKESPLNTFQKCYIKLYKHFQQVT